MSKQIPAKVIDELMDMYVEWRDSCMVLDKAYHRWSSVSASERDRAFVEYRAALDWEEHASAVYQDRFKRVTRGLPAAHSQSAAAR